MAGLSAARTNRPVARISAQAWLLFGLAAIAAFSPMLAFGIWAGTDYPNHFARMAILMRDGTAGPHPFYVVRWGFYPNLAMDLLVPPLGRLVGAESATRLFFVGSAALVVSGAMALGQAAGRRPLQSGIAALLLLYSLPFALGFLNFTFGLGLALWALAAWIALAERSWPLRLAVHAAAVPALAVSHLMALGIYGFSIGCFEIWRVLAGRRGLRGAAATFGLMTLPVVLTALAFAGAGGRVGGSGFLWNLPFKALWLMSLNGLDPIASCLAAGLLALLLYGLARERRLRLAGAGPVLAAGFAALFLAMPFRLLDTAYADVRVAVAAGLILPAFMRFDLATSRLRVVVFAVLGLAGFGTLGSVFWTQREANRNLREIVESFPQLGSGARVLVAASVAPPLFEDPVQHVPTLAAARADAFVPTLFSYAGKQPLVPVDAMARLDSQNDTPLPLDILKAIATGEPAPQGAEYAAAWPRDFAFLYLVGPPVAGLLPAILRPVAAGRVFTLYRIAPAEPAALAGRPGIR